MTKSRTKSFCLSKDAILGFIHDTPFTSGNDRIDAVFIIVLITPVLFLPNYESISKVSALGTSLIGAIFLYFTYYGYETYGLKGISSVGWDDAWPKNFSALSNWFGVAACKFYVKLFHYDHSQKTLYSKCAPKLELVWYHSPTPCKNLWKNLKK